MNFEIKAFLPDETKILKRFGLEEGGNVQKVIDTAFIHYMRLKMPKDSGVMIANTKNPEPGLVTVETPYAHYMNEGIKYVDPETKKGAFYDKASGMFWSRPGVKKIPSGEPLNYHGGADRGAHFVERTINENVIDIAIKAQRELSKS